MALPADTALETAFGSVEAALAEDLTVPKAREVIGKWREVVAYIESLGGTGYDALTQRDWSADDLFTGPND
jgi:hypothetical protein